MRVDDVADVGVVEEVVALAELEVKLPVGSDRGGGYDATGKAAVVALADDAGGADGSCEEVVIFFAAVGGEDNRLGASFGFGVEFDWVGDDEGVVLIRVDEVGDRVVDDGGGGGVDEGFAGTVPGAVNSCGNFEEGACAVDVYFL